MKNKEYMKPTMNIVKLQQHQHLLTGSGVEATRRTYGTANSGVTEVENEGDEWNWN